MKNTTFKMQILFSICALFFITVSFSQGMLYKVSLNNQVQFSSQIIEGKVISKQAYWDDNHQNIYTVNTVEVYKVFKGQVFTEIEVITSGGTVGYDAQTVEPSLGLNIGDIGIFMLYTNDVSLAVNNPSVIRKYRTYSSSQGFYKYQIATNSVTNPFVKKEGIAASFYPEMEGLIGANYQNVKAFNALNNLNRNSGAISIASFLPTTTTAGTASTITIDGSGFGTSAGMVGFSDSNDGGSSFYEVLPTQIISWSDTEIIVEVPSRAGTGVIQVTNFGLASTTSGQTLTVSYAELNAQYDPGSGTEAFATQHIDRDGSGGYIWQMQTDFDANTAANESFVRALDTWRCETGINWTIGSVTTTDAVSNDDINIVRFDNGTELPSGVLGRCTSRWSGCIIVGGGGIQWYVEELDIVFNDSTNWNFGPAAPGFPQYDFESVAVHELGHGHQLGHVIDTNAIMHSSISNGEQNRGLGTNDIAGGGDIQSRSNSVVYCFQPVMVDFDCATLSQVEVTLNSGLDIYPNPVSSNLYIRVSNTINLETYAIFDINGRQLTKSNFDNVNGLYEINVSQFSSGVYFIQIASQTETITKKIIIK